MVLETIKAPRDAIAFLTNFLYKQVDNSDPVIAVFLDLAKAFDTVSHKLLLQKLQRVGIRGKAYELIKNYLYNRKQHVKIENSLSKTVTIKHGVPQGTVLGPLLFLLYINDLLYNEFHCKLLSYADDTIALFTDLHWDNLKHKTAAGLSKIKAWMDSNLLSVNFKKKPALCHLYLIKTIYLIMLLLKFIITTAKEVHATAALSLGGRKT